LVSLSCKRSDQRFFVTTFAMVLGADDFFRGGLGGFVALGFGFGFSASRFGNEVDGRGIVEAGRVVDADAAVDDGGGGDATVDGIDTSETGASNGTAPDGTELATGSVRDGGGITGRGAGFGSGSAGKLGPGDGFTTTGGGNVGTVVDGFMVDEVVDEGLTVVAAVVGA
jgi:hypothetical protein